MSSPELFLSDIFLLTMPSASFIIKIVINALALFIAAQFLDGVQIKNLTTAAMVALVIAFLNAAMVSYLTTDYGIAMTGLLSFIVDAVVIMLASVFFSGFKVRGLLWAIILAVVLSLLNGFLYKLLEHLQI